MDDALDPNDTVQAQHLTPSIRAKYINVKLKIISDKLTCSQDNYELDGLELLDINRTIIVDSLVERNVIEEEKNRPQKNKIMEILEKFIKIDCPNPEPLAEPAREEGGASSTKKRRPRRRKRSAKRRP